MKIELSISNSSTTFLPGVAEGLSVEWERKGVPGKLTFSILKDPNITVEEGNLVKLKINDTGFFQGYVFTQKKTKDDLIQITAYDSLRYLKNKDIDEAFKMGIATGSASAFSEDLATEEEVYSLLKEI